MPKVKKKPVKPAKPSVAIPLNPAPLPEGHERYVIQIFCHPNGPTCALDNYGRVWYWENIDNKIEWRPLPALPQVTLPGEVFESRTVYPFPAINGAEKD